MICRIGKIGGTHVYFKTCWEDIITAAMADPVCDRLGSEDDSTDSVSYTHLDVYKRQGEQPGRKDFQ